jgi:hypothetical protein
MNSNRNKIANSYLKQLFINDLQINSTYRTIAKYMKNKRQKWALLKLVYIR